MKPPEQFSRRHHFVTRSYLDLFADEEGQVLVYDKQLDKEYATNPINAAAITNFNTIVVDGKESDAVEKMLAPAEGKVSRPSSA